ncbi:Protein hydE [hydrothermal vent metagenome]|uniref:Protein hydE n=1 Tax=hydrothermal vent metagenome TaxID=652676 RepID=A0A1W1ECU4_9ZZZZ
MILEFSLDYRSSSLVYEKIFLRTLKEFDLKGQIAKNDFSLKLYVESDSADKLEEFATKFSTNLPYSIFLNNTEAKMVDEMPQSEFILPDVVKPPLPFCPKCLNEVMDEGDSNYYNIFTECEVCGYGIDGESRSYKKEFEALAKSISESKIVELNTFYGKYFVGLPQKKCNEIPFDLLAYDLATIGKYTNAEEFEITTLGAFEKPFIKLKTNTNFLMSFEDITSELLRFKLADDLILHLLMTELHALGHDLIFITDFEMETDEKFLLVDSETIYEPIEVVASSVDTAIVSGDKGLPEFPINEENVVPYIGSFYSVVKEHKLNDENIAGINISREYGNNIVLYGKKYGLIEYLSLGFSFKSVEDIFNQISSTNESGAKIVENFKNKFPEHYANIENITFENRELNIYGLWGIVAIILNFTKSHDPMNAAEDLEYAAQTFLGTRGPRVDYKLDNIDGKVYLDPLMTIRTAMSFYLADVDKLTLCYGVVESFVEFLTNELDEIKQNMDITSVIATGSLLGNRHIFAKMSKEISANHNIYFNNELPVDGLNMFYGGSSLDN